MTKEERFQVLVEAGDFKIDDLGRIWRLKKWGRPCEPRRAEHTNRQGYLRVSFRHGKQKWSIAAHRAVWIYFNDPIPEGLHINHLNGVKDDNRLENLEVATPAENTRHAFRIGLVESRPGERSSRAKLTNDDVMAIRDLLADGRTGEEIAPQFNVSAASVWRIRNGDSWSSLESDHVYPERRQGERNGRAKLTADDVWEIRQLLAQGLSQSKIAARFGVDSSTISKIKTGKNWSHVK